MQDRFKTQRTVTWFLFSVVAAVIANICYRGSITDIKGIYDSLLPLFAGAVGYWIGTSKSSADKNPIQPVEEIV